ncbi:sensor histidine kinase [Agathobaculum sp.]|uniref:sensor histidine kinase n=1 Tax=Agathobaculum sp. TaxID=2048138 RepID=UPI002A83447A|nr:sensor histidine kinase [Agathobaculum sp.]MDY3618411.1 sensor histidine kinase [Agathobaculum sp.]
MAETFFSQLDDETLRALLGRTALRDAALVLAGPTLHIERCSESAARLTGLHPLERIDQLLSEATVHALQDCIENKRPRTVYEELDGVEYRLELLPHREGALLAFLRDDRAQYDGSLRVLHIKNAQFIGAMLADIGQVEDQALAQHMQNQCMRMLRAFDHSDFLHTPSQLEHLRLTWGDLAGLCREAAEAVRKKTGRNIVLHAPERYPFLMERDLIKTALYNLLANALQVTPEGEAVEIFLSPDPEHPTVTVADRGPGLDASLFERLLDGWHHTVGFYQYLELARGGVSLGLGLPLIERIASLHCGRLLLSPRDGGGSELHFVLSHLPDAMADNNLHAPTVIDSYSVEELELSIL